MTLALENLLKKMNRQIRITIGEIHVTTTLADGETANLVVGCIAYRIRG